VVLVQILVGLSLTITPTSASSKIYVGVHFGGMSSGSDSWIFSYSRNGTQVGIGDNESGRFRSSFRVLGEAYSSTNHATSFSHGFIDSPSTTSAITYKIQERAQANSTTLKINRNNAYGNTSDIYNANQYSIFYAQEIA
jgi:hypothetical protein